jgi:hypothetical protein
VATAEDLLGNWSINANGSPGGMSIFRVVDDGPVELRVRFNDQNREDRWNGTWHPGNREIQLRRELPNNATQTYTGYLGDNHPPSLIFGGSFTQSGSGDFQFGWFAQWQTWIIQ